MLLLLKPSVEGKAQVDIAGGHRGARASVSNLKHGLDGRTFNMPNMCITNHPMSPTNVVAAGEPCCFDV